MILLRNMGVARILDESESTGDDGECLYVWQCNRVEKMLRKESQA